MFEIIMITIVGSVFLFGLYNLRLFFRDPVNANALANAIRRQADSNEQLAQKALRQNLPLAATVLMHAVASIERPITQKEKEAISTILQFQMALDPSVAEGMVEQSYRLYAGPKASKGVLLMAREVVTEMCTEQEKSELVDMLNLISQADGRPTIRQMDFIESHSAGF